ncbi:four helix bundle protein [Candidatus Parcubacteria bacterium]|nr:MAG: four helix bundle protein [Candidatus Parcubacteria bacterium]
MKNFKSYQASIAFYKSLKSLKLPSSLSQQLKRAAASVTLNLAEGNYKDSIKERIKFFQIALGSIKECQAVLTLTNNDNTYQAKLADNTAKLIYCLVRYLKNKQ